MRAEDAKNTERQADAVDTILAQWRQERPPLGELRAGR